MNFISHYYFVRHSADPYLVLGMVLPDMVKNHRKSWNLRPKKQERQLLEREVTASVYKGWELHVETDRLFHSSAFFKEQSSQIRKQIAAIVTRLPFRPFFLAHVALELLLDSLLIIREEADAAHFYRLISRCDPAEVIRFLEINHIDDALSFIPWFNSFVKNRYLYSYSETENLVYALDRTGRRVWSEPFSEEEKDGLSRLLQTWRMQLENEYLPIFEQISYYLRPLL